MRSSTSVRAPVAAISRRARSATSRSQLHMASRIADEAIVTGREERKMSEIEIFESRLRKADGGAGVFHRG